MIDDFKLISLSADALSDTMRNRTTISRHTAKYVQELVDIIQEHLDNIMNELTRLEE